jgi:uncharacterized membrane protein
MSTIKTVLLSTETSVTSAVPVESLLTNVTQGSVVSIISLLVLMAIYLGYRLHTKEQENTKLNEYIRESDKENVVILTEVNNTLDRVLEKQKDTNDNVIKEINHLKEFLIAKFQEK